eukprot:TRINITY_DN41881_c0_g1_i1.p1 TRINITY_DN41881_c0_g1~~TRINITY_DN41881_c0_g1_i1.p1  ORF type:complete len:1720 (-),score=378.95 TRINITY_DN41881_c0_g1_i1:195-5354(-)
MGPLTVALRGPSPPRPIRKDHGKSRVSSPSLSGLKRNASDISKAHMADKSTDRMSSIVLEPTFSASRDISAAPRNSELWAAIEGQQRQLDGLLHRVAALLSGMHFQVLQDVRAAFSSSGRQARPQGRHAVEVALNARLAELCDEMWVEEELGKLHGFFTGGLQESFGNLQKQLREELAAFQDSFASELHGLASQLKSIDERLSCTEKQSASILDEKTDVAWYQAVEESRLDKMEANFKQDHGVLLTAQQSIAKVRHDMDRHFSKLQSAILHAEEDMKRLRAELDSRLAHSQNSTLKVAGELRNDLESRMAENLVLSTKYWQEERLQGMSELRQELYCLASQPPHSAVRRLAEELGDVRASVEAAKTLAVSFSEGEVADSCLAELRRQIEEMRTGRDLREWVEEELGKLHEAFSADLKEQLGEMLASSQDRLASEVESLDSRLRLLDKRLSCAETDVVLTSELRSDQEVDLAWRQAISQSEAHLREEFRGLVTALLSPTVHRLDKVEERLLLEHGEVLRALQKMASASGAQGEQKQQHEQLLEQVQDDVRLQGMELTKLSSELAQSTNWLLDMQKKESQAQGWRQHMDEQLQTLTRATQQLPSLEERIKQRPPLGTLENQLGLLQAKVETIVATVEKPPTALVPFADLLRVTDQKIDDIGKKLDSDRTCANQDLQKQIQHISAKETELSSKLFALESKLDTWQHHSAEEQDRARQTAAADSDRVLDMVEQQMEPVADKLRRRLESQLKDAFCKTSQQIHEDVESRMLHIEASRPLQFVDGVRKEVEGLLRPSSAAFQCLTLDLRRELDAQYTQTETRGDELRKELRQLIDDVRRDMESNTSQIYEARRNAEEHKKQFGADFEVRLAHVQSSASNSVRDLRNDLESRMAENLVLSNGYWRGERSQVIDELRQQLDRLVTDPHGAVQRLADKVRDIEVSVEDARNLADSTSNLRLGELRSELEGMKSCSLLREWVEEELDKLHRGIDKQTEETHRQLQAQQEALTTCQDSFTAHFQDLESQVKLLDERLSCAETKMDKVSSWHQAIEQSAVSLREEMRGMAASLFKPALQRLDKMEAAWTLQVKLLDQRLSSVASRIETDPPWHQAINQAVAYLRDELQTSFEAVLQPAVLRLDKMEDYLLPEQAKLLASLQQAAATSGAQAEQVKEQLRCQGIELDKLASDFTQSSIRVTSMQDQEPQAQGWRQYVDEQLETLACAAQQLPNLEEQIKQMPPLRILEHQLDLLHAKVEALAATVEKPPPAPVPAIELSETEQKIDELEKRLAGVIGSSSQSSQKVSHRISALEAKLSSSMATFNKHLTFLQSSFIESLQCSENASLPAVLDPPLHPTTESKHMISVLERRIELAADELRRQLESQLAEALCKASQQIAEDVDAKMLKIEASRRQDYSDALWKEVKGLLESSNATHQGLEHDLRQQLNVLYSQSRKLVDELQKEVEVKIREVDAKAKQEAQELRHDTTRDMNTLAEETRCHMLELSHLMERAKAATEHTQHQVAEFSSAVEDAAFREKETQLQISRLSSIDVHRIAIQAAQEVTDEATNSLVWLWESKLDRRLQRCDEAVCSCERFASAMEDRLRDISEELRLQVATKVSNLGDVTTALAKSQNKVSMTNATGAAAAAAENADSALAKPSQLLACVLGGEVNILRNNQDASTNDSMQAGLHHCAHQEKTLEILRHGNTKLHGSEVGCDLEKKVNHSLAGLGA